MATQKQRDRYINPDGSFKGGWDGCVEYMQRVEGHPKENAERICAYIKEHKYSSRDIGLSPLANRDESGKFVMPADGWFQLAPLGEYPLVREAPPLDVVQVLDRAALDGMVARFNRDKAAGGADLLVDYEHFSYQPDKPSEAAGWITALEARADGLWANIRWSEKGEAAVRGGSYRYISPAWLEADVERLGENRIRPLRLASAGLTNNPNLRAMVALSNRDAEARAEKTQDKTEVQNMEGKYRQILLNTFKLPETATDEEITASADKLAAEGKEITNRLDKMAARLSGLLTELADRDLERYASQIKPEARKDWRERLIANREEVLPLLQGLAELRAENAAGVLHNAANAAAAVANRAETTPEDFLAACKAERKEGEPRSATVRRAIVKYPNLHETWLNRGGAAHLEF
jgi:phage I-like protein